MDGSSSARSCVYKFWDYKKKLESQDWTPPPPQQRQQQQQQATGIVHGKYIYHVGYVCAYFALIHLSFCHTSEQDILMSRFCLDSVWAVHPRVIFQYLIKFSCLDKIIVMIESPGGMCKGGLFIYKV